MEEDIRRDSLEISDLHFTSNCLTYDASNEPNTLNEHVE